MPDLQPKLERCFQAVLPDLTIEQIRQASAKNTPSWDSTMLVTLMSVVEEEFGISVDPEDLDRWTSFEAVRDYIAGHHK